MRQELFLQCVQAVRSHAPTIGRLGSLVRAGTRRPAAPDSSASVPAFDAANLRRRETRSDFFCLLRNAIATGLAMAIAVLVSDAQLQSGLAPNIRAVLSQDLKFSDADLGALARGNVVKHSLDVRASGEIAVVGAVRIGRSEDAFLARVRDVKTFKSDPDVLQIGVFSDPPVAEDLADLTFDKA